MKEFSIRNGASSKAQIETIPFSEVGSAVLKYYEQTVAVPQSVNLGPVTLPISIHTKEEPPFALRDYTVHYPPSLVEGYRLACEAYDKQFMTLVEGHKIWNSDYQYAPSTLAFQVDGPAYSDEFLESAATMDPAVLAEFITKRVFEFETNIAAYGLNGRLWPDGTTNQTWLATLDAVRERTGKKVAVLAVTEQKFDEMLLYELGIAKDQPISSEETCLRTGFDAFLGPAELKKLYDANQGDDSPYVFFGRTSMPKPWLKNTSATIDDSLLSDPDILRFVRAHALTHNFDDPNLSLSNPSIMLDTKEPLVMVGAGYRVTNPGDIYSQDFIAFTASNGIDVDDIIKGNLTEKNRNKLGRIIQDFPAVDLLTETFISHLQARGTDPSLVANGERKVRAKPLKLHYGIYGHEVGQINKAKFLNTLMGEIRDRGDYILQPEFTNLHIVDISSPNEEYVAIDRVFFVRGADGQMHPMESCRSLMPTNTQQGKQNNVHEGPDTKCARIAI